MKKAKKFQHKARQASTEKILELSNSHLKEQLSTVPEIRWDKVSAIRRMIVQKEWNPESDKIVDKILFEHLS